MKTRLLVCGFKQDWHMSIVKKVHSGIFVFLVFLLTCTRVAVARVVPSSPERQEHGAKVSAFIGADSADLRAGDEGDDGSKGGSGGGDGDSGSPGGGDGDNGGGGG